MPHARGREVRLVFADQSTILVALIVTDAEVETPSHNDAELFVFVA
jgi:hypothetical protein